MGWVNSPDFFCSASETVADNANTYVVDPTSPFEIHPPIAEEYCTSAAPQLSPNRLKCINVYMDDLLCAAQGDSAQ